MHLAAYLAPQPDELLSSWVMRTCHANATSFYSLLWHHNKSTYAQIDIDQCQNRNFFNWLAFTFKHPEGYKGIWEMSLLPVKAVEKEFPHRSWIRGIDRRAFKWRSFRYCPTCLKQGQTPYFRKHWRLDWYEVCHLHYTQMYNTCTSCAAPIILHKVKWKEDHLAYCHKCKVDLSRSPKKHSHFNQKTCVAVHSLLNIIKKQDLKTYSAIHFLEAFLDEISKTTNAQNSIFPALFRTTRAFALWAGDKTELATFTKENQKYFNLAVRSFGCPAIIKNYHKPLRVEVQLSQVLIAKAAKEIEATGRKATTKRISKHLTCSLTKVEKFMYLHNDNAL